DYAAASTLLAAWLVEAEQQGLENILLSNERLFAAFADRDTLFRFYEITQQVGISEVHSLMILRDPVDHALSLYKHKGKSGKLPSFGQWIGSAYETPGLLNDLIAHFDKVPINWTFRSYSSN